MGLQNEDLRKWVQEKWVDIGAPKKGGGFKPCGRSKGEKRKGYPKCVPASKAASMSKGQRRSAVKRKRAAGNVGPKPTNVSTFTKKSKMKKEDLSPTGQLVYEKLCARGKAAAKRKFKVYPSAYANMYASSVCSGKTTPGGKKKKKKSKKNESIGSMVRRARRAVGRRVTRSGNQQLSKAETGEASGMDPKKVARLAGSGHRRLAVGQAIAGESMNRNKKFSNESTEMTTQKYLDRKGKISAATRAVAKTDPKAALRKGNRAFSRNLAMRRKFSGRDSNKPGSFDTSGSTSEVRTHSPQDMLNRNQRIRRAATAARRASIQKRPNQIMPTTPDNPNPQRPDRVQNINRRADKAMAKNKAMRTSAPGSDSQNASLSRSDAPRLDEKGTMPKMKMGVHKSRAGGLTAKGVKAYRAKNPGSKLKTAVTTKPSKLKKGSKSSKRRKSFCARMGGMKKRLTSKKTASDPNSRINKALRKWNC